MLVAGCVDALIADQHEAGFANWILWWRTCGHLSQICSSLTCVPSPTVHVHALSAQSGSVCANGGGEIIGRRGCTRKQLVRRQPMQIMRAGGRMQTCRQSHCHHYTLTTSNYSLAGRRTSNGLQLTRRRWAHRRLSGKVDSAQLACYCGQGRRVLRRSRKSLHK